MMATKNEDNLKAFMAENAIKTEEIEYIASKRFVSNGQPIPWTIRALTSEEDLEISSRCKKKTFTPGTREAVIQINQEQYAEELMVACVVFPNLDDAGLQDSYKAVGAGELLKKMLNPGEYADLFRAIQQINGFETGMDEKVKRAKN